MKLEIRNLKFMAISTVSLLLAASTLAADVRMSLDHELISLLDRAVLKIEFIDTKGDPVDIPGIDGLQIEYRGPQSQYQIINGKTSSSVTHTYVITPTKVGDYTIGPVTVDYKGGQKTLSAKLRVIKPQDDPEAQQLSQILFSHISINDESPYVHEPFGIDLKVYVRDGVQIDGQFGIQGGLPESGLDGELQWSMSERKREEHNGAIYNVYTLHATAKALASGVFNFRPEVQLNVVIPRQQRRSFGFDDPFFGDFFGRQETRPMVLDCNSLDVSVKPVPMEGRPASFTGGVGVLGFDAEVEPDKLKAGEPVTIKMRISGKGNLEKITPPEIKDGQGLKLYDVRTIPATGSNEVRFEQVVIPTSDAVKEIPAITFSYFNTRTADFRTIVKGPFPITVEAAPQQAAQVIASVPSTIQQGTKILGHDIAYLKPKPAKWKTAETLAVYRDWPFRTILLLPALILSIAGIASARRNRLANDAALARRQKAPKAARQNIQLAEQAMKKNDASAFYESMWNALTEYFGHRLNLAPGQVALQTVQARMPGEAEAIERLFGTIEQRRYGIQSGGSDSKDEMKLLLHQLVATLKKCERMKL